MNKCCNAARFNSYEEAHAAWSVADNVNDFHTWLFEPWHCRAETFRSVEDAQAVYELTGMPPDNFSAWLREPVDTPTVPNNIFDPAVDTDEGSDYADDDRNESWPIEGWVK